MKFVIQKDSTLKCSSNKLTLDDIETLNSTHFIEDLPVTIHCNTIHQEALLPFFKFIANLKCLYITVYVEKLDYQTARAIYAFANKNVHCISLKLDLGESILAFTGARVMSTKEAKDIEDHLLSDVYPDLQMLIVECRYMTLSHAKMLCEALLQRKLQAVEISCYTLDDETKHYLKAQLTQWLVIPSVSFSVHKQNQLIPIQREKVESEPNCFKKALTWVWSKMCSEPDEAGNEAELIDEEANNRLMPPSKPHLS